MGGVKKKSMASMEKSQESTEAGQEQASGSKGKKTKDRSGAPQRKQLAFLPPQASDAELVKMLFPLKAITVHTAARAMGVNSSVASAVIRDLESKSMLRKAGGFSSHGVWAVR